jgi:Protein of unknown function (DUF1524)
MKEGSTSGGLLTPSKRKIILGIALILILVVAMALGLIELRSTKEAAVSSGTSWVSTPAEASDALKKLKVASPGSMSGYSRDRFPHWSKATDFGWNAPQSSCDSRQAALIRDGTNVKVGKSCKVTSGKWLDPYTGKMYSNPQDLDIDHVVPLANAWRSGASSWDDKQRERYANDPDVLLTAEDNANQAKGDKGPEAWKPPDQGEWCDYAERWIQIKSKYSLSVNEQEKSALEQMLGTCAGS